MSKNISIAEGGVARQFTNDKLKINLVGGGTEYYVPESGVQLTTKSVTANGTYKASDEGKYGFSQFSVNVRGAAGSADSHGKPTGGDIKPGGAGSAVTGTDPETGEEVVVGIDEGGNIVQTPIPYGIKIVTPPTKTDYEYQETMDYTGIMVKLTNKNGDTYTDVDHPSGWYVNPADLIFPVDKAPAGGRSYGDWSADPRWVCNTANAYLGYAMFRQFYKFNSGPAIVAFFGKVDGWAGPILISDIMEDTYHNYTQSPGRSFLWEGKIFFMNHFFHFRTDDYGAGGLHVISADSTESAFAQIMSAANVHVSGGGGGGGVTIPVKWNNPYTGETHQDTFQITSTGADGDAHTSTGSSGQEGSGGGGSF